MFPFFPQANDVATLCFFLGLNFFFLVFVSSFQSCFHRDFWLKGKTPVVSEEHSMSVTQEFNEKQSGFRVRPLRPNHTLTFFTLVSLHRRFHYYRYLWSFYLSLLKKKNSLSQPLFPMGLWLIFCFNQEQTSDGLRLQIQFLFSLLMV